MNLLDRWLGKEPREYLPKSWSGGGFSKMREAMDKAVDRMRRASERENWAAAPTQYPLFPPVDIAEDDTAVRVRIDLPGLRPEDVKLDYAEQTLTISGRRRDEWLDERQSPRTRERHLGSFQRSIHLPTRVAWSQMVSTFETGVLLVIIPKVSAGESIRIPVSD